MDGGMRSPVLLNESRMSSSRCAGAELRSGTASEPRCRNPCESEIACGARFLVRTKRQPGIEESSVHEILKNRIRSDCCSNWIRGPSGTAGLIRG